MGRRVWGVSSNVFLLGVVSFFTDVSSEMIFPILPLFLVATLGASKTLLGFIEGLAESTSSLIRLLSGWLSDRLARRKPLVVAGYSLSNLAKPLFALATSGLFVLVVRVIDRVGKGVRSAPRDALIAESAGAEQRGRAFGFHRSLDNAGELLGPALAALFLLIGLGFRDIFLLSIIPGAIALAVLLALVREPERPTQGQAAEERVRVAGSEELRLLDRRFLLLVTGLGVLALATFSKALLFPAAAERGIAIALIPLIYLATPVISTLGALPMGALSDRVGRKALLIGGSLVFAAMALAWVVLPGAGGAVAAFALFGLYLAATEGAQRAFVVDLAQRESRGTALGLYHMVVGLAALPASLIAGYLFQVYGSDAMFLYGAGMAVLAALIIARV